MAKMTSRRLGNKDLNRLTALIKLYADVFEMDNFESTGPDYLNYLLKKDEIIFYTAEQGNDVVGGLTAYILPSVYSNKSEVYIYDLAIARNYQRQGIGTSLIENLKIYCKTINVHEIFVQADVVDNNALDFYRKIGGIEEDVRHFDFKI